jgi:uncharacterized membrane protein YhaH (DUF805 family)
MRTQQINNVSSIVLMVLSLAALFAVLTGYTQPPQPDEGAAAHVFQLSMALLVPVVILFLATADWTLPVRRLRPLAFSVAVSVVALGLLYYLEHYR